MDYLLSGLMTYISIGFTIAIVRFWNRTRIELNLPSQAQGKQNLNIDVRLPKENLIVSLDDETVDSLSHLKKLNMSEVKIPPVEIKTERKSTSLSIDNPKRFDIEKLSRYSKFGGTLCVIKDNGLNEQYLCFLSDSGIMTGVGNIVDA